MERRDSLSLFIIQTVYQGLPPMSDPDRSSFAPFPVSTDVHRPDFVRILSLALLRLSRGRRA